MSIYCVVGEFDEYYIKAPNFDAAMCVFEEDYNDEVITVYIVDQEGDDSGLVRV